MVSAMGKSSTYQRSLAWAARKTLLRRNAHRLAFAVLIASALNAGVCLLLWLLLPQSVPFVLEGLIIVELGFLWLWLIVHDGELHRRLGIMGETWSKDELTWLTKRGWSLFNNVSFEHFDVDHVLIGPGGVFAFETKLSTLSDAQNYTAPAAHQSVANAKKITRLLRSYRVDVHTIPVLLLWGPGYRDLEPETFHDVTVVLGNDARSWIRTLEGAPRCLDEETVRDAADAVRHFQDSRQKYEADRTVTSSRLSQA